MAYITQSDIAPGKIPTSTLTEALDDNGDGDADSGKLDAIIAAASLEIDSALAGRYTVPFGTPAPALVRQACVVYVLESLYEGRGWGGDKNPWKAEARALRGRLDAVGKGHAPLEFAADKKAPVGAAITADSKITSTESDFLDA